MTDVPRFECASSPLALNGLLGAGRYALWACFSLGVLAHVSLTQIHGLEAEKRASKPLTTHFIKRQPRLTKPLELKKRPQPKRRAVHRRMVAIKARIRHGATAARFRPVQVLGGLARPRPEIARMGVGTSVELEPAALGRSLEGAKDAQQRIDMSLELLDVLALDTGRYHAMVIVDPTDKRGVKGFLHLASAYPFGSFPRHEQKVWAKILPPLVTAMNKFTDIKTDIRGKYSFDSRELFKMPWLYTRHYEGGFKLTASEAMNLGKYLLSGGFLFAEGVPQGSGQYTPDTSLRQMMKDALELERVMFGKDWDFQKLPNSHSIYHCYFDFDGPPIGSDWHDYWPFVPYLEGIELSSRLTVLLSDKNYAHPWADWGVLPHYSNRDPTRQLQFGVNSIVFALTQEGSVTHRLMESIR